MVTHPPHTRNLPLTRSPWNFCVEPWEKQFNQFLFNPCRTSQVGACAPVTEDKHTNHRKNQHNQFYQLLCDLCSMYQLGAWTRMM